MTEQLSYKDIDFLLGDPNRPSDFSSSTNSVDDYHKACEVIMGFTWHKTTEGSPFWVYVHSRLEAAARDAV